MTLAFQQKNDERPEIKGIARAVVAMTIEGPQLPLILLQANTDTLHARHIETLTNAKVLNQAAEGLQELGSLYKKALNFSAEKKHKNITTGLRALAGTAIGAAAGALPFIMNTSVNLLGNHTNAGAIILGAGGGIGGLVAALKADFGDPVAIGGAVFVSGLVGVVIGEHLGAGASSLAVLPHAAALLPLAAGATGLVSSLILNKRLNDRNKNTPETNHALEVMADIIKEIKRENPQASPSTFKALVEQCGELLAQDAQNLGLQAQLLGDELTRRTVMTVVEQAVEILRNGGAFNDLETRKLLTDCIERIDADPSSALKEMLALKDQMGLESIATPLNDLSTAEGNVYARELAAQLRTWLEFS